MEKFYNEGKIVYWLELYNIKHPVNNIGKPPIEISIDLPEKNLSNLNNNEMNMSHVKDLSLIYSNQSQKMKR